MLISGSAPGLRDCVLKHGLWPSSREWWINTGGNQGCGPLPQKASFMAPGRPCKWSGQGSPESEGLWGCGWGAGYAVCPVQSHSMKLCQRSTCLRIYHLWLPHQGSKVTNLNWICNPNLANTIHDWKAPWIRKHFESPHLMGHHLAYLPLDYSPMRCHPGNWAEPCPGRRGNADRGPGPESGNHREFCLGSWGMLTCSRPKPQSPIGPGLETHTKL